MAFLRQIEFTDHQQLQALARRHGLGVQPYAAWVEKIVRNPLRAGGHSQISLGWVLTNESGQIVGQLTNVPIAYRFNCRDYVVTVPSGWAVDREFRDQSLALLQAYLQQPGVDLFLTNTASHEAGRLLLAFKFTRVPVSHYDKPLFWITHPVGFAASCLRKKRVPGDSLLKYPAGVAIRILDQIVRWPRRVPAYPEVQILDDIDSRFDVFWECMAQDHECLYACRDRSWLKWHCGSRLQEQRMWLFAASDGPKLVGYMLVQRQDADRIGLKRAQVVDLQYPRNSPALSAVLLQAAYRKCQAAGVHILEAAGFSLWKRGALESMRPWRRRWSSFPALYKAVSPTLTSALGRDEAWDLCQFDADASS